MIRQNALKDYLFSSSPDLLNVSKSLKDKIDSIGFQECDEPEEDDF